MNSYPALTLKAAKHEMKDENTPNPEPNRSRKPDELQPGGVYEYENRHCDVATEFLVNLVWFVADVERGGTSGGQHKPFGFALVAA